MSQHHDYIGDTCFMCFDCGHDVKQMRETFMILDDLWTAACHARPGYVHMLCVACTESRLGMRLQRWCFTKAPLNWDYPKSLRLRQRMLA
jgi:hypothetical protein